MHIDTIIIGQGLCGTFLSHYLHQSGVSFILIDESKSNTASKSAAGIINPVTGRRLVKTWMIEELMPFAQGAYQQIGDVLNINCISQKKIVDFFPTPQMRIAFLQRFEQDKEYLKLPDDENAWRAYFNYDFGFGEIAPVYLVDVMELVSASRKKLIERKFLMDEHFDISKLNLSENKIRYQDIIADKIIFCDGIESFQNPFFKNLPFAPNKGESLVIEINEFPGDCIYKKGLNIVPLNNNLFWVGSSYEWQFESDKPNKIFSEKTELILLEWLKSPFKILDHFASIRPATLERRPFVGFHPLHKNVGILNGMGTKGCSLAPYFANQLVQNMMHHLPIHPEADIIRFARILSRL
ncbi:MAG TPA: FAD-dependent oxidoreductase [Puia sp.]|nr:FAD-dependent oxidoreductase [Puia sp.]